MTTRAFQRNESVPIYIDVRKEVGGVDIPYTPSGGIKLYLWSPLTATLKVNGESVTELITGRFVYYYNSAADDEVGWWKVKAVATDGVTPTRTTVEFGGFFLQ